MDRKELDKILADYKKGEVLDLSWADLSGVDLYKIDFLTLSTL